MSSLIIKVSKDGNSQDYLFNKPGPIIIGSDKKSDLWLDDQALEGKVLEIKLSGGNIFIKEVGSRGEILLDSNILPFRQETRYQDGSVISFTKVGHTIQIEQSKDFDSFGPPPFFDEEYKDHLARMNQNIRIKENDLRTLSQEYDLRKNQLEEMEARFHRSTKERNELELIIDNLKNQKESITKELRQKVQKNVDEEEKISQLKNYIAGISGEERKIKDTIVAQNLILANLKDEREKKSKEIDEQRNLLFSLKIDINKLQDKLCELHLTHENQTQEIQDEQDKIQSILIKTENMIKEQQRVQNHMGHVLKEKALLDHEVEDLQGQLKKLELQRKDALNKLTELKIQIEEWENHSRKIREEIKKESEEESNLKTLNAELRLELVRLEDKLSAKKNQINNLDFQGNDASRKLETINFEIQRSSLKLKELSSEEKGHELKMKAIRDELHQLNRKLSDEKKLIVKAVDDTKAKLNDELNQLRNEIEDNGKYKAQIEADQNVLKMLVEELETKQRILQKEKISIEVQVDELLSQRTQVEAQLKSLKDDTVRFEHDRGRALRELSALQIKIQESEIILKEKNEEARIEIEALKRDERARILAEKELCLAEVEAFKQKSLIEVETEYRRKQDDIYQMKSIAQDEADAIISEARKIESDMTQEAHARLREATESANERELASHDRIKEAQNYFKQKEVEAEAILNKARIDARELIKNSELEILDDLAKRKQKIKKFLTMKQELGLTHIKNSQDQHHQKMKRDAEKSHQRLEDIKKKELKKIARIREEEIARQAVIKDEAMKELKIEKEKVLRQINELKKSQEAELASKKKTMLEHINSTKITHQQEWEDELKREKENFNRTKKERILNSTAAVINVLVSENGPLGEREELLREKIKNTLEMAIDGQKAHALKEVDQVLDFNPEKRKKVIPVIQKYSLRVGLPLTVVITILADIGSVRTSVVNITKEFLKQQSSASELYVNQQKNEWKEKNSYLPELTTGYKRTFTDNVIYTKDFSLVMDNEEFQNEWILKIHDFIVKDLELSEDIAINYISSEATLIKELAVTRKDLHPKFLDVGLKKMTDLEELHLGWMKEKIPDSGKIEKLYQFRKDYFDKFYAERFTKQNRQIASELPLAPAENSGDRDPVDEMIKQVF